MAGKRKSTVHRASEADQQADPALLSQLRQPSKEERQQALRTAVGMGFSISEACSPRNLDSWDPDSSSLDFDDVASVINELGTVHPRVYSGLSTALEADDWETRVSAIRLIGHVSPRPPALLVPLLQALSDKHPGVRKEAALALYQISDASPVVLRGIGAALRRPDIAVQYILLDTIRLIGIASPEILRGLEKVLENVEKEICEYALDTVRKLGQCDASLLDTIRDVAKGNLTLPQPAPDGVDDDDSSEAAGFARVRYDKNRAMAAKLLEDITSKSLRPAPQPTHLTQALSDDDQAILAWFKHTKFSKHLTVLQVYWCIGHIDQAALQSGAQALGYHKLEPRLKALRPHFKGVPLDRGIASLSGTCMKSIANMFNRDPFGSHQDPKRPQDAIRKPIEIGNKPFSQWTPKAWKAWQYVDRYLTITGLLPEFAGQSE